MGSLGTKVIHRLGEQFDTRLWICKGHKLKNVRTMKHVALALVSVALLVSAANAAGPGLSLLSPPQYAAVHYHAPNFACVGDVPAVTGMFHLILVKPQSICPV